MTGLPGGLVLTYHAIERGPRPLCLDPALFERHVDVVAAANASVVTVSELANRLRAGTLEPRTVAITFDDGFASVREHAVPALGAHGFRATVFAVSGHLGGSSDWSTQPAAAPRLPLLDGDALAELARAGWEIGSHGHSHRPLGDVAHDDAVRELEVSRERLAGIAGTPIRSFAFPYGSLPRNPRELLLASGYEAGCSTQLAAVTGRTDPLLVPRVDAHYVRDVQRLDAAIRGASGYLRARSAAARVRRLVRRDYVSDVLEDAARARPSQ